MGRGIDGEVQHQREHEIGRGAGEGDGGLLARRLLEKAAAAVLGRQLLERVVSGELDVAAQRQERDAVFGLAPHEAGEPRAEPDGKAHRLDAEPLSDEQVPKLVEEDDHANQHGERDQGHAGRLHPGAASKDSPGRTAQPRERLPVFATPGYSLVELGKPLQKQQSRSLQILFAVAAAFATLHISYGAGFLAGLVRWRKGFGALLKSR